MDNKFKKKYFKTNVLIKNIIGKELINDDNVAVMELVKNSYDAGASKVTLEFKNLFSKDKLAQLIIQDDGIGMNEEDIINKWLNIAYSSKKIEHTQNSRYQAGNKGVGRFSCDRLGEELHIYTRQENQKIIHLKINWKDFELLNQINKQIQDVPVYIREIAESEFQEESGFSIFKSGTILQILKLNSEWSAIETKNLLFEEFDFDTNKLLKLKGALERLINPNQEYNHNSFKIYMKISELYEDKKLAYHKRINGEIKNQIFEKLDFKTTFIESTITEDGSEIVTELKDKNKTIFRLIEKNNMFPLLSNIKITIYYLNPYAKGFFTKQTGIQPVEFGSIFLFINGFRILPYGDRENDSFGLEVRKNQGRARYFGNREILGRIEIKDFDNSFRVITSREGIVQNSHYKQLIRDFEKSNGKYNGYFYTTLKRLEKYVVDGIKWDSIPEELNEATIQKEIIDGTWNKNEVYRINDSERSLLSSDIIKQMLSLKKEDVLDLYINEQLIENLIEEDKEKSNKKLEDFIKNFGSIASSTFDEKTKKALEKLSSKIQDKKLIVLYKNALSSNKKIEEELEKEIKSKDELYKLYKKKLKDEKKAKDEKRKLELLNEEKEQEITYLKTIPSRETKELIAFQHHIGLYAKTAKNNVLDMIDMLRDNQFSKVELLNYLKDTSLELDKISAINKYITREDFLTTSKTVTKDLVKFIDEYIKFIYEVTTNKELSIAVNTNNLSWVCKFEPIKLNIIIDNLLNNSKKAKANNVIINFVKDKNTLLLEYLDDGQGLDISIIDKNAIFNMGITTTKGSGLGLYHIKEILQEMNQSSIEVEAKDKGIKFIIRFKI